MAQEKKTVGGLVQWRRNMPDGSSKILVEEEGLATRLWDGLRCLMEKAGRFFKKARDIGANDPRKVVHSVKVGMAVSVVSLFYFMAPLYDGVGGNAMWAVMTVVVVFENTVGATIYKSLNRVCATSLAGMLGFGVHWVATRSGQLFEPFIVGASLFIIASVATFSRFIPSVKQRFDYGAMIFVLTFSLVAVSGHRVDRLFELAHERISTIIIGTSLCILTSMLVCPIWAGGDLHTLIITNMNKLANSLDGCVAMYFNHNDGHNTSDKKLLGYKCVLSSKASEESMSNFARWEPAHGIFSFKHPWTQYPKIGASMRNCAYCIEALTSCIGSENQAPELVKKQIRDGCLRVSSIASNMMRELGETMKTMKRSSSIDVLVEEMRCAIGQLQESLRSLSSSENSQRDAPVEMIQAASFGCLVMEIGRRSEGIVKAVEELGVLKVDVEEKCEKDEDEESMKTLERV